MLRSSALCTHLPSRGYRLYAIAMKSWIITGPFVCITVAQCAVGIHLTYLAAIVPGMTFYEISAPNIDVRFL